MTPKTLVIYHDNCPDGFAAAWAASQKLGRGPDVQYLPASYGDVPPNVRGLKVFILDFAYSREDLISMCGLASSLLVLDHHETHQKELQGLPFAKFDMDRSGAGMAWDHFNKAPRPPLINYVEDRDLWRWRMAESREINAYIYSCPRTFEKWDALQWETDFDMAIKGRAVTAYKEREIEEAAKRVRDVYLFGELFPAVQNTNSRITSDLLNRLAEKRAFAAAWSISDSQTVSFSLRSSKDGADVGEIARIRGGGGHRHAAGFRVHLYPRLLSALLPAVDVEVSK